MVPYYKVNESQIVLRFIYSVPTKYTGMEQVVVSQATANLLVVCAAWLYTVTFPKLELHTLLGGNQLGLTG